MDGEAHRAVLLRPGDGDPLPDVFAVETIPSFVEAGAPAFPLGLFASATALAAVLALQAPVGVYDELVRILADGRAAALGL